MSLSKECQEYHLTPKGWILGSFEGDSLGGSDVVPIPKDRVLTIACYDELSYVFEKPHYYDQIIWQSDDKQLIDKLKNNWGEKPDWVGYKLKKEQ